MPDNEWNGVSRRDFLKAAGAAGAVSLGAAAAIGGGLAQGRPARAAEPAGYGSGPGSAPPAAGTTAGKVDGARAQELLARYPAPDADFYARYLTSFDTGKVTADLGGGRVRREYEVVAIDRNLEIAPGVVFPAWTFNGAVPGPTLRATEGDEMVVHFTNLGAKEHTIHFHGFHPGNMDGTFEVIRPGGTYEYRFTAEPFGLHLYHCHVMPLRMHIMRGLYGVMIIDPREPRPKAREMVMLMNGFDTDMDGENEFYTVNGYANYYTNERAIPVKVGELQRIYLVNVTEFDLVNSLHTHATFFHVYRTGTKLRPDDFTDTIMLCQGERAILEFTYPFEGRFMFHAHQSEFAELGWLGHFIARKG